MQQQIDKAQIWLDKAKQELACGNYGFAKFYTKLAEEIIDELGAEQEKD